jgi:hypothetical protein
MSLSLDVYNKKKQNFKQGPSILDRRRFKGGRSKEENLIEELNREIETYFPFMNKQDVIKDLLKLKDKIRHLNFYLLLNVYYYFSQKNFNLEIVFLNFGEDYKEEYIKMLEDNPYKSDLKDKLTAYKFRQDYIMYLFLLENLNLNGTDNEDEFVVEVESDNYLEDKENFGVGEKNTEDFNEVIDDEFQQDY